MLADLLGDELALPVFLYGQLAGGRTRAEFRRGGPAALAGRIAPGELRAGLRPGRLAPDAPARCWSPRARRWSRSTSSSSPPATSEAAKRIAASIREGGPDGLPAVRAIGLWLEQRGHAQVSTNVEDHARPSPGAVVQAIARARARRDRAPNSSDWRRGPRSTTSRTTSRCAAATRSRTRWPDGPPARKLTYADGPDQAQSVGPSTAEPPPGTSPRAGARASPPSADAVKKQKRDQAREKRLNTPPTWQRPRCAVRAGGDVHPRVLC